MLSSYILFAMNHCTSNMWLNHFEYLLHICCHERFPFSFTKLMDLYRISQSVAYKAPESQSNLSIRVHWACRAVLLSILCFRLLGDAHWTYVKRRHLDNIFFTYSAGKYFELQILKIKKFPNRVSWSQKISSELFYVLK